LARKYPDKIFINTAGIGLIPDTIDVSARNARPGDVVIINGSIADHGIAILTRREGLQFQSSLRSDSAPLNRLVAAILDVCPEVHVLRDPTRGGVATALNEIASRSDVAVQLYEEKIPISAPVRAACEILGLDPLYVANEGTFIAVVPPEEAESALNVMRKHPQGRGAVRIGEVTSEHAGKVIMRTSLGARRIVTPLSGDLLPRIC
jgi:hydrogenase expression/formation protein HypE